MDLLHTKAQVHCLHDYYNTPGARELAHRVKENDPEALLAVAEAMAGELSIEPSSTLIPVPSSSGEATNNLVIAWLIAKKLGVEVSDCLRGTSRKPLYAMKKEGHEASAIPGDFFGYHFIGEGEPAGICYLIDVVVGTGATLQAASSIFKQKPVMIAFAMTDRDLLFDRPPVTAGDPRVTTVQVPQDPQVVPCQPGNAHRPRRAI